MTLRRGLLIGVALLLILAMSERRLVLIRLVGFFLPAAELTEATDQGPQARWVDDYYTVEAVDDRTFAIGEPRYYQKNFSYLIVGSERAVLFDAGPGVRDIRPIAASLTDRPITFVPSHLHYDHLGDGVEFANVAMVDLPYLRDRAPNNELTPTNGEHLGFAEGFGLPALSIHEWVAPGSSISLGDRSLLVLHTPGHTQDSISLVETSTGLIFSGDFLIPGPLFSFLPGGAMGEYLLGVQTLLAAAPDGARILAAHRTDESGLPELSVADAKDLETTLLAIQRKELSGKGSYPVIYEVNDRVSVWAEPRWLQRW